MEIASGFNSENGFRTVTDFCTGKKRHTLVIKSKKSKFIIKVFLLKCPFKLYYCQLITRD